MSFFNDCLVIEEQNESFSAKAEKKALELYKDCIDLCSDIRDHMMEQSTKKQLDRGKFSSLLIINRLLFSSQSIRILTLKGYSYEALILQRSFFEGLGLSIFLSENPKEAKSWFKGKRIDVTTIELFELVPKIINDSKVDVGFRRIYGFLCDHVHDNLRALIHFLDLSNVEHQVSDGENMSVVPVRRMPFDLDKRTVANISAYPLVLAIILLRIFRNEIDEKQKKVFEKRIQECLSEFEKK